MSHFPDVHRIGLNAQKLSNLCRSDQELGELAQRSFSAVVNHT